jgi:FkbM family methyltransferase
MVVGIRSAKSLMMNLRTLLSRIIAATPVAYFPVKVRAGAARGAKWTLAPFSSNWRFGGEGDLLPGMSRLPNLVGAVCWDFGAHFGIHSVGMAMQVGNTGQVASFEPDPVAFGRLKYHLNINRLSNVESFQRAVSNKTGSSRLIMSHGLGSAFSHFQYEDELVSKRTPTLEVATVAPDELVSQGIIRPPDLIKVDVQGHGAKALDGSIGSIRARRPIIIFSNHSQWELAGTRTLLEPLGYSVVSLNGNPISWNGLNSETGLLIPSETERS